MENTNTPKNTDNINKGDVVIGDTALRTGVRGVVKIVEARVLWLDTTPFGGDPLAWAPVERATAQAIPAEERRLRAALELEGRPSVRDELEEKLAALEAERRGLKPVAGGTNELDEVIVELRGRLEAERKRAAADAERIGAEARRTGSYITGEAAGAAARRAEGLELVLRDAGHKAASGSPRVAVLLLKGTLGDKVAAKAARAYHTDADLERAESLSAAQDYTDGGGPRDEAGARLFDD